MKKFSLFVLIAIMMSACSDNMMLTEPVENTVLARSNEQASENNYTVTPEMVCKYLNIARKGKVVSSLSPIIEDGDTLAYIAQYPDSLGWELISGDRRLAPVLAYSEKGILYLNSLNEEENPAMNVLNGMIEHVKSFKLIGDTLIHSSWKSLEPKKRYTPKTRGYGAGKWIEVGTESDGDGYLLPHIITTNWGQGSPWDIYTPLIYGVPTKVGCVGVAASQIIYNYRKNNHRDITLPTIISRDYTGNVSFSGFSTTGWDGMANDSTQNGTDVVAKFMSYIGDVLDLTYGVNATGGYSSRIPSLLTSYKLTYDIGYTYNYSSIISSLDNGKPVYIDCSTEDNLGHAFIIDSYNWSYSKQYTLYKWDPNIEITEEEYLRGDYLLFPEPTSTDKDGYAWIEDVVSNQTNIYFAMNWGWDGYCDSIRYLVYNYDYVNNVSKVYPINWSAGGNIYTALKMMIYNISEME